MGLSIKEFRYVASYTMPDCLLSLFVDWILRPSEFEERYQAEVKFQLNLKQGWGK